MGLLVDGTPLSSEDMKPKLKYIKDHGVIQFLNTWRRVKDIQGDQLKFGDEIESGVFEVDHENKTVKLSACGASLMETLKHNEELSMHETEGATWHPEFGAWMIESTPSRPYSNYASDLLRVERNMLMRRRRLLSVLGDKLISPTVTCFPLMGVGDFIANPKPFSAPHSQSDYVPDYLINPHPRFATLVENIRNRRGRKVDIRVPLFKDKNTPEYQEGYKASDSASFATHPNAPTTCHGVGNTTPCIHMDAMAFGMGMCCLQVTFQARDCDESRYLYDQGAVLAPIMLALTAGTPIFKGRLADVDARWDIIAGSVDDRTPAEMGELTPDQAAAVADPRMAGSGIRRLPKSRYDSVSTYIYHCNGETRCTRTFERYNDVLCPVDEDVKRKLDEEGIDSNLSHHLAHLFTRDSIVSYAGFIEELDDEKSTDHFECIQSTNWQSCRWKPPPPPAPSDKADAPYIGWRTEFRSMEVQLTDFENAAFTVFVVLITRVLLAFDLGLYIPLSKVDENMKRAMKRDAATKERFYFRKHMAPLDETVEQHNSGAGVKKPCCGGGDDEKKAPCAAATAAAVNNVSGASPCTKDVTVTTAAASAVVAAGSAEEAVKSTAAAATAAAAAAPCAGKKKEEEDCGCKGAAGKKLPDEDSYEEMSMNEIMNGKGDYFPGFIPLIYAYLEFIKCDKLTFARIKDYLVFIERRARGELQTPAAFIRNYVQKHPSYKQDSVVSPDIAYDLMMTCNAIGTGEIHCPEILGDLHINR